MHSPVARHGPGGFDFMFIVAHHHELPIQQRKRGAAAAGAASSNPVHMRENPVQVTVDAVPRVRLLGRAVDGTGKGPDAEFHDRLESSIAREVQIYSIAAAHHNFSFIGASQQIRKLRVEKHFTVVGKFHLANFRVAIQQTLEIGKLQVSGSEYRASQSVGRWANGTSQLTMG